MEKKLSSSSKLTWLANNVDLNTQSFSKYLKTIIHQDLILKYNYETIMEIGKIKKITLNTTSKLYVSDKKHLIPAALALQLIAGQKPVWTYAKHSIAPYKIREDQLLGCKVDLRRQFVFHFLEKWCRVISPRIRDLSKIHFSSLDSSKNYSLGIQNIMIFPELENHFEILESFRGLTLNFVFSTQNKQQQVILLSAFQIPVFLE